MIKIVDKKDCCGCTACYSICPKNCISMKEDEEGFLYPSIDESSCIGCNLCEAVCPILNKKEEKPFYQEAYVVQHKDEKILRESTAGGAFTAIAEYIISQNGVVFGASMTKEFVVKHTYVEDVEGLALFRNSKYVQSDLNDTFKICRDFLKVGRLVLYSGTPCQIEGLKAFLKKEYDNLITVDVVCRAVPSPGVWSEYVKLLLKENDTVSSIRFRDKSLGYQYSTMEINFGSYVSRAGIESDPWLRMFFSGMIIRHSCTSCKFRNQFRKSDFTIWDCFGIYRLEKSFNEDLGTSRVLVHTGNGRNIFDKIKNNIKYKNLEVNIAIDGVRELLVSPNVNNKRLDFYNDLKRFGLDKALQKYLPNTFIVVTKRYLRLFLNVLGLDKTIKHILKRG